MIAARICERLAAGESMAKICASAGMPDRGTVRRWQETRPDFAAECARARVAQGEHYADMIADTAHQCTTDTAQADKVKISAYQWLASKLDTSKYGDKTEVTAKGNLVVQIVDFRSADVQTNDR